MALAFIEQLGTLIPYINTANAQPETPAGWLLEVLLFALLQRPPVHPADRRQFVAYVGQVRVLWRSQVRDAVWTGGRGFEGEVVGARRCEVVCCKATLPLLALLPTPHRHPSSMPRTRSSITFLEPVGGRAMLGVPRWCGIRRYGRRMELRS